MRCLNCGYNNEPNARVCVKCGKPFNMGGAQPTAMPAHQQQQSRPTVLNVNAQIQEPMPRPTQLDTASMIGRMDNITPAPTVAQNCPACGFPVTRDTASCPSCGYPLAQGQQLSQQPMAQPVQPVQQMQPVQPVQPAQQVCQPVQNSLNKVSSTPSFAADLDMNMTVVCEKCGAEISIANKFCPHCGERVHLSTMPIPRKKSAPLPQCSLSIVPEEDENIKPTKQVYAGNSIVLNRDNTQPTNRTITSRQQAILTYEDGKWFIENKSDYCTTYVVANRKIELQTGDVIILGDRNFVFEAEQKSGDGR